MKKLDTNNPTDVYIQLLQDLNKISKKYQDCDEFIIISYIINFLVEMLISNEFPAIEKVFNMINEIYDNLEIDKHRE